MTKYNLEYLEKKLKPFNEDFKYPTIEISGFNLIYLETENKSELDGIINTIKEEMNPGYIWSYVKDTNAVYVIRAFGENRIFIYNPETIKQTEYVKGKLQVLDNLSEDTFNELFDQKAVFNYFYTKLWEIRRDLGIEIRDKNDISDNKALMEAQHIIDRIIFSYFICEKGLVKINEKIPINSRDLFNGIASMPNPWKCLKNLFFEQFAKKESDPLLFSSNTQIVTPYLNGGLFRPKKIDEKVSEEDIIVKFSNENWKRLFGLLNKYTWIIEDKIPDHTGKYEGNLTPEIIGHIYEKFVITMELLGEVKIDDLEITNEGDLKKGNKKIGAYYTPEEITDFITRKTISSYLIKNIGLEDVNPSLDDLIGNFDEERLQKSLEILKEIKICDPSCGSGAFLLKAGEVLLNYQSRILEALNSPIDTYFLKKEIIVNNLYGVDIQEGAVEICKLRLWLWLISSTGIEVDPLPNIEYNFIAGNSLIGWAKENLNQELLFHVDKKETRPLFSLKIGYGEEQKLKIDNAISLLEKKDVKSYAKALSDLKSLYSYSEGENAEILKMNIKWIREAIYTEVNPIFHLYMESKDLKIPLKEFENMNPFHWAVDFYEIFSKGGFDLIIGNPPYGNLLSKYEKKWIKKTFTCNKATNIAENFFERTLEVLLKNDRLMGYVIPKTIAFYGSWEEIREKILTKNLKYTFDVGIGFVGVNYEEIILIVENTYYTSGNVEIYSSKNLKSPFKDKEPRFIGITPQSNMNKTKTIIFRPIDSTEQQIIEMVDANSLKFREIYEGKAFRGLYISNKEKEKFKPGPFRWINKVPDVKRYYIDKHIDIALKDEWKNKAEKILKPRLFFKVLRGKRLVCFADLKGEFLTTEKLVNVIIKPEKYKIETLMLIINSYMPSFYIQKMLFSETTETSRVMDDIYVGNIPIAKVSSNQDIFVLLYNFMILLNSKEEFRKDFSKQISYIDMLIDCLVYEIYLKDELQTNLVDKLNSTIGSVDLIDFDDINQLKILDSFIQKTSSDQSIVEDVNKINNHEWIKVINSK